MKDDTVVLMIDGVEKEYKNLKRSSPSDPDVLVDGTVSILYDGKDLGSSDVSQLNSDRS